MKVMRLVFAVQFPPINRGQLHGLQRRKQRSFVFSQARCPTFHRSSFAGDFELTVNELQFYACIKRSPDQGCGVTHSSTSTDSSFSLVTLSPGWLELTCETDITDSTPQRSADVVPDARMKRCPSTMRP